MRKRVFPIGSFFVCCLIVALACAWVWPSIPKGLNQVLPGELIIGLIFFVQGWKIQHTNLLNAFKSISELVKIQLGIILIPLLFVLVAHAFSWVDDQWLMPFLFMAMLPTTISSCVVYCRAANGDADYAIGHSVISNLIAPLLILAVWIWFQNKGSVFFSQGSMALFEVSVLKLFLLVLLPSFLGWILRQVDCIRRIGQKGRFFFDLYPMFGISILAYISMGQMVTDLGRKQIGTFAGEILTLLVLGWLLIALISWGWSCWLQQKSSLRIAIFFCTSQKSMILGLPLLHILIGVDNPVFGFWAFPLIALHFIQLVLGACLIPWIRLHK